ncbi:ABC transporter ATP-binding protein [Capillimicrobium parvum]|uniref:Lipopolysaccharide export system ATP-binding protein LptB n=1 Tax=Capillimicrobium parvum TaxID=2884022 RepID=A0A9E6Y1A3_9ACTN|nr:ABC transporter ATP-binding protein [Capillimicrobium parvum]UGS38224.1 Lipopolysaccharide export system ATP-binding protein LptB [Capillimicrobium parvum]
MTVATRELLRLEGLGRRFGGLRALRDIDLGVREGEIMGLIGPNGAGKTTLVSVVSGQIAASEGRVSFGGDDVTGLAAHRRARAGIGRTFQNVRLFAEETVLDNVKTGAYLLGRSGVIEAMLRLPRQRTDEREIGAAAIDALQLVGLADRALAPAGELSTGEQRLAELAKAAAMRPRLLFLDEPAAGLNPTEEARLAETIQTLSTRMTLVVIEHHLDLVMSLCDRVAVLDFGRLICVGTPDEVRSDPGVIAAYLGPDPAREG